MGKRQIKIKLYSKEKNKEDILQRFGDYILDDICISCVIEEVLETGEYFLDAEFHIDNEGIYKHLEEDAVLKVLTDYGEEIFSIVTVRKTFSRIIVFARQITICETMHCWCDDVRPEVKNGKDALIHLQGNSIGFKNLSFESDIETINTAYYLDKTVYEAIHKADNCFLKRWGGEVRRRGYTLTINKTIGEKKDIQIRSKRNLTGFEANTSIENTVTRIKPKGFNGLTPLNFVDSPFINNYKYVRTKVIEYEHIKLASDIEESTQLGENDIVFDNLNEARDALTELAELEYSQNAIDILDADYTINFIDLSTTEEYKNYMQAEVINLGDYIDVYEEKHDINITVRAIKRKFNVLTQRVIEIELSNKSK